MVYVIITLVVLTIIGIILFVSYNFFSTSCVRKNKKFVALFEKIGMDSKSRVVMPNVEWYKEQKVNDYYITSKDGLKLHASFLPAPNAVRTVICVHGYRGNAKYDFSAIIRYLNSSRSNVLLIDQRASGASEGEFITFGAKEKEDLVQWVDYTAKYIDVKNPLYLYGISMGATTTLLSLESEMNVRLCGAIADCGFTSMKDECKFLLKNLYGLPVFPFINLLNVFCNMFAKFDISETDTTKSLEKNKIPVLFIHGENDSFVIPENTRINYSRTNAPKDLVWIKNANHAESILKDPELYHTKLEYFFNTYK